ncbi:MAG: hypothetical protein PHT51_04865 [Patescibacteria group bacterium]|nr:hypothetical protein [Patescibacteria group bacterium]MDD4610614.1 hypothetical protein [Patescibacteria group bacterium]
MLAHPNLAVVSAGVQIIPPPNFGYAETLNGILLTQPLGMFKITSRES